MNFEKLKKDYPLMTLSIKVLLFISVLLTICFTLVNIFVDADTIGKMILITSTAVLNSVFYVLTVIPLIKRSRNLRSTIEYNYSIMYMNKSKYILSGNLYFETFSKFDFLTIVYSELIEHCKYLRYVYPVPILCSIKNVGDVEYLQFGGKNYKKVHGINRSINEIAFEWYPEKILTSFGLLMHELAHVILCENNYLGDQHEIIKKCDFSGYLKRQALKKGLLI